MNNNSMNKNKLSLILLGLCLLALGSCSDDGKAARV